MAAAKEQPCKTVNIAARHGKVDEMVSLIKTGKPVDVMDNRGWRPTHEAANDNHVSCLKQLLEHDKTDINWRAFDLTTALLLACQMGHLETVRVLLEAEADPNLPDCFQLTPLLAAVRSTKVDIVKQLLEAGANVDDKLYCGTTALHQAAAEGFIDIVNILLEKGASVDSLEDYDITPVFTAAQHGQTECLKALLETAISRKQANIVNMGAEDGATPLYLAAQDGHYECVKLLLDYGADPNLTTDDPVSLPLLAAVNFERIRCVELLLKVTDMQRLWECEPYIYDLAMLSSSSDCLKTILEAGIPPDKCHAVQEDIYVHGIDNRVEFKREFPALVWCCWFKTSRKESLQMLIDYGASVNALAPDYMAPLLAAACKTHLDSVKVLIRNGSTVNINHPIVEGNLALIACLHGWKCLSLLLLCNAKPDGLFVRSSSSDINPADGAKLDLFTVLTSSRPLISRRQLTIGHVLYLLLNFANSVHIDPRLQCFVEDEEQWSHIYNMTVAPRTLAHKSRLAIRTAMGSQRLCNVDFAHSLPLPSILRDYVMFMDLDRVLNVKQLLK